MHDDPVLRRLADADPSAERPLPGAASPEARRAFAAAIDPTHPDRTDLHMHTEPSLAPSSPDAETGGAARPFGSPPATVGTRSPRRWGALAGVAAAGAVVTGGVLALAPGGSTPALAAVQTAADTTASITEGVMRTTVDLAGTDGSEQGDLSAEVITRFDQGDLAVTVDVLESSHDVDDLVDGPDAEAVLVDGVAYARAALEGDGWYAVEAPPLVTSAVEDLANPRSILAVVDELVEATEDGTVELDGETLTRYVATVDLSEQTLQAAGALGLAGGLDVSPTGTVDVVLLVEGDVLRVMTLTGTAGESSQPDAVVDFEITVAFDELGVDQAIAAPADATVLDLGD